MKGSLKSKKMSIHKTTGEGSGQANLVPASPRVGTEKRGPWEIVTAVCLSFTVMMALLAGVSAVIYGSGYGANGTRDFAEYWAAGRLLVHGENPYDFSASARLEQAAGMHRDLSHITPSPPPILWLLVPLGFVNFKAAAIVWMMFLSASFLLSVKLLSILNGQPGNRLYLLSFCFLPPIYCVMSGQIGNFLLLGVTLFLFLHESHPFWAGAALVICTVKPHLFLPFGLVLILWILRRKRYRILIGFAAALMTVSAIAAGFDPHAWAQWVQWLRIAKPAEITAPTLSSWFRFLTDQAAGWLEFLPAAIACAWALWYFFTRRSRWNWMEDGLLLLIISVGCAPYAWVTDEALLLPALLVSAYRGRQLGRSLLPLTDVHP